MKKIFQNSLFALFAAFVPMMAFAAPQVISPTGQLPGAPNGAGQTTEASDVLGVLPNIIAYVIGITAVLAIIAATWAGIQMFLSVGNEQKFDEARNILIYALVGVGLAGGAFLIVQIVSNLSFK